MEITDVKIRHLITDKSKKVRAIVSIVIDGDFAIHDLKVIEGMERLFVAMPNRKDTDGRMRDICHPINQSARDYLEKAVLDKYQETISETKAE